jgi:NAD-dependent dihydropyrimidine dehydrogenase PreA subunit
MMRKIIKIDEERCSGCGACADACREGAVGMVNGKAKLLRDDCCDGLGNCLPSCPTGAIGFEIREAAACDKDSAKKNMTDGEGGNLPCGCPGTQPRRIRRGNGGAAARPDAGGNESRLSQWPVQIRLAPVNAPYFADADLLIAADCAAYAHGDFHNRFMKNRVVLIGCPKLDDGDYGEKLAAILKSNGIRSVTVARMEVPCCGGIEQAVKKALRGSGKFIPRQVMTISTDGRILE